MLVLLSPIIFWRVIRSFMAWQEKFRVFLKLKFRFFSNLLFALALWQAHFGSQVPSTDPMTSIGQWTKEVEGVVSRSPWDLVRTPKGKEEKRTSFQFLRRSMPNPSCKLERLDLLQNPETGPAVILILKRDTMSQHFRSSWLPSWGAGLDRQVSRELRKAAS